MEGIRLLRLAHVPVVYMERAGFKTFTAASHQMAIKMFWLHFSGCVWHARGQQISAIILNIGDTVCYCILS